MKFVRRHLTIVPGEVKLFGLPDFQLRAADEPHKGGSERRSPPLFKPPRRTECRVDLRGRTAGVLELLLRNLADSLTETFRFLDRLRAARNHSKHAR